jgi:hypothetical protein
LFAARTRCECERKNAACNNGCIAKTANRCHSISLEATAMKYGLWA